MELLPTDSDDHVRKVVAVQRVLVGGLALGAAAAGVVVTTLHFAAFEGKEMATGLPRVGGLSVLTLLAGVVAFGLVETNPRVLARRVQGAMA